MKTLAARLLAPFVLLVSSGTHADGSAIVAAGYGDPLIPTIANFIFCRGTPTVGLGGMPVVFNEAIDTLDGFQGDPDALDPSSFEVAVGPQARVTTPVCATVAPAVDANERRTVLLVGDFGLGSDDGPVAIRVVGDVMTVSGSSLLGAETTGVNDVNGGPTLVLAEAFDPSEVRSSRLGDTSFGRFCPSRRTTSVVKLTFSGGVSGPFGAALRDDDIAMEAIQILGFQADGRRVVLHPIALRDDDNDNHLDVCLGDDAEGVRLIRAQVDSHNFYAPQNVPNRAITVGIQ